MSIAKPQIKNGLQEKFKVSLDELKSMISEKRIRSDELKQSLEELMDLKLEFNVLDNEKWKSWHKMVLVSEISIDDITKNISMHGMAININPNFDHYKHIVPCGIADKGVTSLSKELTKVLKKMGKTIEKGSNFFGLL